MGARRQVRVAAIVAASATAVALFGSGCARLPGIEEGMLAEDGGLDAGSDTGLPDTGSPDIGLPDTVSSDTGSPDAGLPDAGLPRSDRSSSVTARVPKFV